MSILRSVPARISLSLLLFSAFSTATPAQTSGWSVPVGGYVYDASSLSIRSISGFVGSAVLGATVVANADWASVAPNQKSAIVQQGQSVSWIADLANPSQSVALTSLYGVRSAFWSADSTQLVTITLNDTLTWLGLKNGSAVANATWKLGNLGPRGTHGQRAAWAVLAADSAADRILLAAGGDGNQQLWSASGSSQPALVPFSGQVSAAAFATHTSAAYIADTASHHIFRIDQLGSSPSITPVVSSDTLIQTPIGMALSVDDQRISLVDGKMKVVRVFDAGSGSLLTELPIESSPDSIVPIFPGRFMLESSDSTAQSLYFVNTGVPPTVFFVPRGE